MYLIMSPWVSNVLGLAHSISATETISLLYVRRTSVNSPPTRLQISSLCNVEVCREADIPDIHQYLPSHDNNCLTVVAS